MRNEIEDMKRYMKSMMNGGMEALAIEEKYGLDGYPPEIVTTVLNARINAKHEAREECVNAILNGSQFFLAGIEPEMREAVVRRALNLTK
jgi:hypothetical protein